MAMNDASVFFSRAPRSTRGAVLRVLQAGTNRAHAALIARTLNAVADAIPHISARAAEDAAGESSSYDVLLSILEQPEVLAALRRENPLAPALVRGLRGREEILRAEGGTVGAREAAGLMGMTRQSVDNRRRANRLIGLSLGRRGYAYPVWQFAEGGTVGGLEAVLDVLRGFSPWMQAQFMLTGDARLGGQTPLAALRSEQVESVLRAAAGFGEHGAA